MSDPQENPSGGHNNPPSYGTTEQGDRAADVLAAVLLVLAAVVTMTFWVHSQ